MSQYQRIQIEGDQAPSTQALDDLCASYNGLLSQRANRTSTYMITIDTGVVMVEHQDPRGRKRGKTSLTSPPGVMTSECVISFAALYGNPRVTCMQVEVTGKEKTTTPLIPDVFD